MSDPLTSHDLPQWPGQNLPVPVADAIGPTHRIVFPLAAISARPPSLGMRPLPVINGYRLLNEIGRGGMGVVYKAWQENVGREVALKVVPAGPHQTTEERLRFRREATTAGRLSHPNIVPVFDVGESAGNAYLAMQFVEGGTLRDWQDGRPIPPRTAAQILVALADAVQHAHSHDVIHRDLKPANILLTPTELDCHEGVCVRPEPMPLGKWETFESGTTAVDGTLDLGFTPKIADFGLAKVMGSADITATGFAVGTPNYIGPEQLTGGQLSPRTDVYQLGAILFELLTGRPAFNAATAAEVLRQVATMPAPSPRQFVPTVPRDLEVIVARCLEKDPARRFQTAADLHDELNRFLHGKPLKSRPLGPVSRGWRWAQRHPSLSGLAALLWASAVGGVCLSVFAWQAARQERANRLELELERSRAEYNLHIARQVTRDTLLKLAHNSQLQDPQFVDLRRELLDNAKPVFDTFVTQHDTDPGILREQAELCRDLGKLRTDTGDLDHAFVRFDQSLVGFRRLHSIAPDDRATERDLCDVLLLSARVCRNTGRGTEGDSRVDEAAGRLRRLLDDTPLDQADYPPTAALFVWAELAFVHSTSSPDRLAHAEDHVRTGMLLAEQMYRKRPDDPECLNNTARAHRELGQILAGRGATAEAVVQFKLAATVRERQIASRPFDIELRSDLAEILFRHASCVPMPEANPIYRRVFRLATDIHDDAPSLTLYLVRLAGYHAAFGRRLGGEAGVAELTHGIDRLKAVPPEQSRGADLVGTLRELRIQRAAMYEKLGRPADAARDRESAGS
jgi:serine/threonine protein kinase